MTSVKIKGIEKDAANIKKEIFKAIEASDFEKQLAIDVRAKIRKDGIRPDISPMQKKLRAKISSRKGPGFSPGKSSLTISGQFLAALTSIFQTKGKRGAFYFGVKDATHKGYRVKGKRGTYKIGGKARLIEMFDGLMKDRPVTKVFEEESFRKKTERKLVASIKRFYNRS